MSELATVTFDNLGGQAVVDVLRDEERRVYLTIGGKPAVEVTPDTCDTCRFLFTKLGPGGSFSEGVGERIGRNLSASLKDLRDMPDAEKLVQIGPALPRGRYSVVLTRLAPVLTMPGDLHDYFAHEAAATWGLDPYFGVPHSPRTPYYRLGSTSIGPVPYGGSHLGVVLGVPLYPPTRLRAAGNEAVERYRGLLRDGSTRPTALALGLVDDRGPAVWDEEPQFTRHLIVTLHLLDGHNKVLAAAEEELPLQFLVFLPHTYLGRDETRLVKRAVDLLRHVGEGGGSAAR